MNKKQLKKHLEKTLSWWVKNSGLAYQYVTMRYEYKKKEDHPEVNAVCYTDWRYQTSTIVVYLPAVKYFSKRKLEEMIVHECMHIFLNEMREKGLDHEERVATTLQKAFMWVRSAEK